MKENELAPILSAVRTGRPLVLLDDEKREGEADLVFHAKYATQENICLMRKEAGGLICLATDDKTAGDLGIGFSVDELRTSGNLTYRQLAIDKTPYGDAPAFSLWINSRKTFTGITDNDRSRTITEFEKMINGGKMVNDGKKADDEKKDMRETFVSSFYAPGHVPLLISRTLAKRSGHTELVVALALAAKMTPAMVICEILDDDGNAMAWKKVRALAASKAWAVAEGPILKKRLG